MNRAWSLLGSTFLLLLSGFIRVGSTQAQTVDGAWEAISGFPKTINRHDDIFFVNAYVGWIVNGRGEVFRSNDSGRTWSLVLDEDVYFRSVGFANEEKAGLED